MPLNKNASMGKNISEFHTGKTYANTKKNFGKKKADKQAVAVAYSVNDNDADDKKPKADMSKMNHNIARGLLKKMSNKKGGSY